MYADSITYKLMQHIPLILLLLSTFLLSSPLQEAINQAAPYATIKLSRGIYQGNLIINKPLTLLGKEPGVTIRGDHKGSVITIKSSHVRLENLNIRNSGQQMISLDSAIAMDRVSHCSVHSCRLSHVLYGIDMKMTSDSNITHNTITSNGKEKNFRGDAIKLWYGRRNRIEYNTIINVRDVTMGFSEETCFSHNRITGSRHGLAIERCTGTNIHDNYFQYNATGIMLMGAIESNITHNQILSCQGAAGIGLVVQGGGRLFFEYNDIKYNAKGFYIDTKIHEEGMRRYFRYNKIIHNKEAFHFHLAIQNNTIEENNIIGNLEDVVKDIKSSRAYQNSIRLNYWDHYQGFDKNGDTLGDHPHQIYQYADQLWSYNHKVKFFYASPLMSLLDFLGKLAPFVEPSFLLEDKKPHISPIH